MNATALNPASPLARLMESPMRSGKVIWIGLRPGHRVPLVSVPEAEVDPETGLTGDHYTNNSSPARQVTLIQAEHIAAIAGYLGLDQVGPELLRRNIVVAGINLMALKNRYVQIGSAVLLITGDCHPCSRMEENLGPGGYNAVRSNGGITARIIRKGQLRTGDSIKRINEPMPVA